MSTELLGDVVAFQDPKGEVTIANVRAALSTAGLSPESAPDLTPRAAFSRACKDLKESRQIDKVSLDKDTRETKFQLTRRDEFNGEIHFLKECFAYLNLDTGVIRCDDSEIENKARQLFAAAMQARTATDITRIVQGMFKAKADLFALVPNKGVAYFVPEVHRPFTDQIEAFYSALGGRLCRFPVPKGTESGNASVKAAVDDGLAAMAAELSAAVDAWDETTRQSTMDKAIERWQAISYKVDSYGEYLESAQGKLRETLDAAKSALAAKISKVGELKEAAKAEKQAAKDHERPLLADPSESSDTDTEPFPAMA